MAELPPGFVWEDEATELSLPEGFVWEDEFNAKAGNLRGDELPGLNRREKGKLYDTPKGPAFWQGNGWLLPGAEDVRQAEGNLDDGGPIPMPRPHTTLRTDAEMGIQDNPGMFSRFADAASEGFKKGFGESEVYEDQPSNFLPVTPQTGGLNRALDFAADTGEGALRALGGAFSGLTHTGAQAAREMGMSDENARRLERDLTGLIDTAGIMTAGGVPGYGARTINKAQRHANRLDDINAYDRIGVDPFAPALSDTDLLGKLTHTAENIPFAGKPISDRKVDIITDTARASEHIADDLSPSKVDTLEEGGEVLQKGLDRFSNRETFLNPVERMSDKQISRMVAHGPSQKISFSLKQEALYENAWRKLPDRFKSNEAKNPDLVPTRHSANIIRGVEDIQTRIGVSGGALRGKFAGMAKKLRNGRANLSIETLRHMRTEIGRMLSRGDDFDVTLDRGQLKQLYGAITQDITEGMETIARRAAADPAVSNADTVAAFQAVRAFKRADQFTKAGMERIEKLMSLTRAKTPERAADRLMKAALSSGQGNLGLLRAAKRSLSDSEWNDMASLVLKRLGQAKPGSRGMKQDAGFSPATFATEWNKLSEQGKSLIFGTSKNPARQAIDALARVSGRVSRFETNANHSNTFNNATTLATAMGGGYAVSSGFIFQAMGVFSGAYGYSKLVTNPKFARWLAKTVELRTRPNAERLAVAQAAQLQIIAQEDPDLIPLLKELASQK